MLKVSSCVERDRLSRQWRAAVDKFTEAVLLLQAVAFGNFQKQYDASRLARENVENARQELELHRSTHPCERFGRSLIGAVAEPAVTSFRLLGGREWPRPAARARWAKKD
jgi:hypothetical protein